MLFSIVGSSCSGKTVAARACAPIADLVVHDFDELGVPAGADREWRQRSTETWIRRVLDHQAAGADVLLTGQSPLGEVLACPSAAELDGIAAALLDVADPVRLRRLDERDPGTWDDAAKQSFLGWAAWLRGHAADPHHRPEVIVGPDYPDMRWSRWSDWSASDGRWQVKIFDTTCRTVAETSSDLARWVTESRQERAAGRLALGPGWAGRPPR